MSDVQKMLHSAYSFIRGVEANKSAGGITLDHLLQQQINRLQRDSGTAIVDSQGQSVDVRPSVWDRLDVLATDIDAVVDAIRAAGDDADRLNALGLQESDQ